VTLAPAGKPGMVQFAAVALLCPLLTQVMVPVTVCPALTLVGKVLPVTAISACATMSSGLVSTLLPGTESVVADPAVVVIFKVPGAGAVKVLLQTMLAPTANGSGAGLGTQLWVAPTGSPLNAQVGLAAELGPALRHVPETVTLVPSLALGGTLVVARMSA
jgi:hypothetical protein